MRDFVTDYGLQILSRLHIDANLAVLCRTSNFSIDPHHNESFQKDLKKTAEFSFLFSKKGLTNKKVCAIILRSTRRVDDLGVAQLVARYLGVVEAASSSLVTQTKIGGSTEPPIFFCFLANSLKISCFLDKYNGLVLPCFEG